MEPIDKSSPESIDYKLRPETAELCLGTSQPDPHRKWAYVNALCAFCLAIAAVGFKPSAVEEKPLRSLDEPIPIPWEQADPQELTATETQQSEQAAPDETQLVRPQVINVQPTLAPGGVPWVAPAATTEPLPLVERGPLPSPTQTGPREWHAGSHNDNGFYPPPGYPPRAQRENLQGVVVLDIVVGEGGAPEEVTVRQSSGHSELDEHTIAWVKGHWHWPAGPKRYYFWSCSYTLTRGSL